MADDDSRPSFADVVKAVTPPGTSWEEFKAAMNQAHMTGGHQPGRLAPDVSLGPPDPFAKDHAAGVAIAEMLRTMTDGGVPLASAERIIGAMLAVHGQMSGGTDG